MNRREPLLIPSVGTRSTELAIARALLSPRDASARKVALGASRIAWIPR